MTTFYKGYEGTVKFDSAGASAAELTAVKSWSLSVTKDLLKTTAYGDTYERFVGGLVSGKGSVEILYTGNNNTFIEAINNPADTGAALFELYIHKTTNKRILFNGIIDSADYGATADDIQVIRCSFVTTGTITMEI